MNKITTLAAIGFALTCLGTTPDCFAQEEIAQAPVAGIQNIEARGQRGPMMGGRGQMGMRGQMGPRQMQGGRGGHGPMGGGMGPQGMGGGRGGRGGHR